MHISPRLTRKLPDELIEDRSLIWGLFPLPRCFGNVPSWRFSELMII